MPRADTSAKHPPPPPQMGAAAAPIGSRNASPQSEAAGQQPKQHAPRSRPKLRMLFSWELFMHAQCHILTLLHLRTGLDLTTRARIADIKLSTLRDFQNHKALNSYSTLYKLSHSLGYTPDKLCIVTRRWLRIYIRAQQQRHQKPRNWLPPFPWQQPPCQNRHG